MKSKKSDKKTLIIIAVLIAAILILGNKSYSVYSIGMTPQSQTIQYGTNTVDVTLDYVTSSGADIRSSSGAIFIWKTGTHPLEATKAYCENSFDDSQNYQEHFHRIATIGVAPYYDFSPGSHTILFCEWDSRSIPNGKCEYNGVNRATDESEFVCAGGEVRGSITVTQTVTTTIPYPPIPDIWAVFNQLWNSILDFIKSFLGI